MKKTPIRGLGSTKPVESIKSSKNKLEIKGIIDEGHDIYLILDQEINFSDQAKETVNAEKAYSINSLFKTSLVPVFEIVEVRKGSLAEVAEVKREMFLCG